VVTKPLGVSVVGGTLQSVTGTATPLGVRDASRATPVAGTFTADRSGWVSTRLKPARTYRLTAVAIGVDGVMVTQSARVKTRRPARTLSASVTPGAGQVVGVGMPVIVNLSQPVTTRAARAKVEGALTVLTSRPVGSAAWGWISRTQLQYRPRTFWPAYTTVKVKAKLAGIAIGKGVWAVSDTSRRFKVGRAQIMKVDGRRHTYAIKRNGKTVRRGGVSLGKSGFTTRSGTKVIMSREVSRRMRSNTVGIVGGVNSYDLQVPYAMRLTHTGEFVHGAPWNRYVGAANVSHGCTNLTLSDAKWLYRTSKLGDPLVTKGTSRRSELGSGWGGVWNLTWANWKKRSAVRV
jgi:lipoprotein-anchoring transpeptidase ErfK/SrfK